MAAPIYSVTSALGAAGSGQVSVTVPTIPAGAVVVALITTPSDPSPTCTSANLTFGAAKVRRVGASTGVATIYATSNSGATLTNEVVTYAQGGGGSQGPGLCVVVLTEADTSQLSTVGDNAGTASASWTVTVNRGGSVSWVLGCSQQFTSSQTATPDGNSFELADLADDTDGNGNHFVRSIDVGGPGNYTIGGTWSGGTWDWAAAAIEILSSPITISEVDEAGASETQGSYGPSGPARSSFQPTGFQHSAFQYGKGFPISAGIDGVEESAAVEGSEVYGPVSVTARTAFQPTAFQEDAFQVGGGGVAADTNKAEVDTATASDPQAVNAGFLAAEVDTASGSDPQAAVGKQAAAEVDTATPSENEDAKAGQGTAEVDSASATEAEADTLRGASAELDTATATEAEADKAAFASAQVDTATASDAQDGKAGQRDSQTDTATALDLEGYSASGAADNKAEVDTALASDPQDAVGRQQTAQADTATALDNYQAYAGYRTGEVDAATALDNYQAYGSQQTAQADTAIALDFQGYAIASAGGNKEQIDTATALEACAANLAMRAGQVDEATATDVESRTPTGTPPFSQVFFVWDGANWI